MSYPSELSLINNANAIHGLAISLYDKLKKLPKTKLHKFNCSRWLTSQLKLAGLYDVVEKEVYDEWVKNLAEIVVEKLLTVIKKSNNDKNYSD